VFFWLCAAVLLIGVVIGTYIPVPVHDPAPPRLATSIPLTGTCVEKIELSDFDQANVDAAARQAVRQIMLHRIMWPDGTSWMTQEEWNEERAAFSGHDFDPHGRCRWCGGEEASRD
jgi:hypothetical protein